MSILLTKKSVKSIFIITIIKLVIAGLFIGFLHSYDFAIALILLLYIIINFEKRVYNDKILFWGMLSTGLFGTFAELWGIHNHYWFYHDLSQARTFPYWLPLAWGSAFRLMYNFEKEILSIIALKNIFYKYILFFMVSLFFPVIGEIITINLGVWTYTWPYQFFGVPLIAMFLLIVFHMAINTVFLGICRKYQIKNAVFNR
jgi:hypothetical protein